MSRPMLRHFASDHLKLKNGYEIAPEQRCVTEQSLKTRSSALLVADPFGEGAI